MQCVRHPLHFKGVAPWCLTGAHRAFVRPFSLCAGSKTSWRSLLGLERPRYGRRARPFFLPWRTALELRIQDRFLYRREPQVFPRHRKELEPEWSKYNSDRLLRLTGRKDENWTVQCTVFEGGDVIGVTKIARSELCSRSGVQPRDLRKINITALNVVPTILIRSRAILFNVQHIKALIMYNQIYLFETQFGGSPSTSTQSAFVWNLGKALREEESSNRLPYELRALETMISSVSTHLEGELAILRTLVLGLLEVLEHRIDQDKLKQLLHYSRRLSSFIDKVGLFQSCLDEVLANDHDMADAYLTAKAEGRPREPDDHEELEQLFEVSSNYVEGLSIEGKNLLANIRATEDFAQAVLAWHRNTLLAYDLQVSLATAGLAAGALITGLFGMNLESGLEQEPYAFHAMSAAALGAVLIVSGIGLGRLYRLRRVGLGCRPGTPGMREIMR